MDRSPFPGAGPQTGQRSHHGRRHQAQPHPPMILTHGTNQLPRHRWRIWPGLPAVPSTTCYVLHAARTCMAKSLHEAQHSMMLELSEACSCLVTVRSNVQPEAVLTQDKHSLLCGSTVRQC